MGEEKQNVKQPEIKRVRYTYMKGSDQISVMSYKGRFMGTHFNFRNPDFKIIEEDDSYVLMRQLGHGNWVPTSRVFKYAVFRVDYIDGTESTIQEAEAWEKDQERDR